MQLANFIHIQLIYFFSLRVRRSTPGLINVLAILTNQTTIKTDVNSILNITHPSPNITQINETFFEINFGYVQNSPTPVRSYQGLTIVLKFKSASLPLILSGRSLVIISNVVFTGGQSTVISHFNIIGPICKPLLRIVKSVKVNSIVC